MRPFLLGKFGLRMVLTRETALTSRLGKNSAHGAVEFDDKLFWQHGQ